MCMGKSILSCFVSRSTYYESSNSLASSFTAMFLGDGQETWYPDTGASACMTPLDGNLVFKCPYNGSTKIIVVNGTMLSIALTSSCYLTTNSQPLLLRFVFHVSHLKCNFISTKSLCRDNNCQVISNDSSISIQGQTMGTVLL